MKDRSKNAARSRREKENAEFSDLARLLPLPTALTTQLDKASVIRLTTSYLKMRELFPTGLGSEWGSPTLPAHPDEANIKELSSHLLQSLDGFVFVLDPEGKIIYISETATVHLGIPQVELTGNNIFEYVHSLDSDEMRSILKFQELFPQHDGIIDDFEVERSFTVRMKCILAKRNAGLVAGGYKVIHCSGYLKLRSVRSPAVSSLGLANQSVVVKGMVAVGHSIPPSAITEVKMTGRVFMFRASFDLTLVYVDEKFPSLIGYETSSFIGKTLYQFVHANDCLQLKLDHSTMLTKGQVVTKYYRLLTSHGGWVWIQSHCTVLQNSRSSRPQSIVMLNYIISDREYAEVPIDKVQLSVRPVNGHGADASRLKIPSVLSCPAKDTSDNGNFYMYQKKFIDGDDPPVESIPTLLPYEDGEFFHAKNGKRLRSLSLMKTGQLRVLKSDRAAAEGLPLISHVGALATAHVATPSPSFAKTQRFFSSSPTSPSDACQSAVNQSSSFTSSTHSLSSDSNSSFFQNGGFVDSAVASHVFPIELFDSDHRSPIGEDLRLTNLLRSTFAADPAPNFESGSRPRCFFGEESLYNGSWRPSLNDDLRHTPSDLSPPLQQSPTDRKLDQQELENSPDNIEIHCETSRDSMPPSYRIAPTWPGNAAASYLTTNLKRPLPNDSDSIYMSKRSSTETESYNLQHLQNRLTEDVFVLNGAKSAKFNPEERRNDDGVSNGKSDRSLEANDVSSIVKSKELLLNLKPYSFNGVQTFENPVSPKQVDYKPMKSSALMNNLPYEPSSQQCLPPKNTFFNQIADKQDLTNALDFVNSGHYENNFPFHEDDENKMAMVMMLMNSHHYESSIGIPSSLYDCEPTKLGYIEAQQINSENFMIEAQSYNGDLRPPLDASFSVR